MQGLTLKLITILTSPYMSCCVYDQSLHNISNSENITQNQFHKLSQFAVLTSAKDAIL